MDRKNLDELARLKAQLTGKCQTTTKVSEVLPSPPHVGGDFTFTIERVQCNRQNGMREVVGWVDCQGGRYKVVASRYYRVHRYFSRNLEVGERVVMVVNSIYRQVAFGRVWRVEESPPEVSERIAAAADAQKAASEAARQQKRRARAAWQQTSQERFARYRQSAMQQVAETRKRHLEAVCMLNEPVAPYGRDLTPHPLSNELLGREVKISSIFLPELLQGCLSCAEHRAWNGKFLVTEGERYRGVVAGLWLSTMTSRVSQSAAGFGMAPGTKLGDIDILYLELAGFEIKYPALSRYEDEPWHQYRDGCITLALSTPRTFRERLIGNGPELRGRGGRCLDFQIEVIDSIS